jgi:hypothetical protein
VADSLRAARDAVFTVLTANANGAPHPDLQAVGVQRIYDHEPPTITENLAVTVVVSEIRASEHVIEVRLYRNLGSDGDARLSHEQLIDALDALEDRLNSVPFGPSGTIGIDRAAGTFVAELELVIPRSDF